MHRVFVLYIQPRILPIQCYMQCFFRDCFVPRNDQREGNLFLLAEGKRRKGKALLQSLVLVLVERAANVLFPLWWTLLFVFEVTSGECKITL